MGISSRCPKTTISLVCFYLVIYCYVLFEPTTAQRSLQHWKRDLEYRLALYRNQRNVIDNIIYSSIQPNSVRPVRIAPNANVRFSDLIIPQGSLVLDSHLAKPTVKIMVDKTESYVNTKMNELYQIRSQLDTVRRQLDDPQLKFIYKGRRDSPQPSPYILNRKINGTRIFKQVQYIHLVDGRNVTLRRINQTNVDRVINDTYMKNTKMSIQDPDHRLFFEGTKTFWSTVFTRPLKSGCCDRLKPLHTNRMMLRSAPQDVLAPVLIQHGHHHIRGVQPTAVIRELKTERMYNRQLTLSPVNNKQTRPGNTGLQLSALSENYISLPGLINIRHFDQPEILKTLVFKNTLQVDEAYLSNSFPDGRLLIGLSNNMAFDLSHENHLLKYAITRNYTNFVQQVLGPMILSGPAQFLAGVDAHQVNQINDFNQFVQQSIVRIDMPATIRGQVQFNALPALLNPTLPGLSRSPQNVLVMRVGYRGLEVGLLNGMRVPDDIIIFDLPGLRNPATLRPNQTIFVHGQRNFLGTVSSYAHLQVSELISGLKMPAGVIPLHLNDFMHTIGESNLWFVDGIFAQHMTIQSGQFDEINLRDVHQGDAQSLIMRSIMSPQPDGSQLIRAPLRVMNLNLISRGSLANHGLLNGFRPQDVRELSKNAQIDTTIHGSKTFLAPVEVADCVFNDINSISNWTNHLIRIDRPNTVQTIHTKLAFTRPPQVTAAIINNNTTTNVQPQASSIGVNHLRVEFFPDNNPVNYANNWHFSPEFYIINQALLRATTNSTGARYRVLNQIRLMNNGIGGGGGLVNNISLNDIVTVDRPFRFSDTFVMVGKVEIMGTLRADRIRSNYPIDAMDLVQFDKYRIPLMGSRAPIQLNNLVLGGQTNQATFVQTRLLNGIPFSEFVNSIMSLTKPQTIDSTLIFQAPVDLQGIVRTESTLNSIKGFRQFANSLKNAKYSFENGLQCNSLVIV